MRNELTQVDTYQVVSRSILNNEDRRVLTNLYQPIIGYGAAMLFFTMWSEIERDKHLSLPTTHRRILAIMGITVYQLEDYRQKLEAIGLLKTYITHGRLTEYRYVILTPLSPKKFFASPLLAGLLKKELGEMNYDQTKHLFSNEKLKETGYDEITMRYDEVFNEEANRQEDVTFVRDADGETPMAKINMSDLKPLLKDAKIAPALLVKDVKIAINNAALLYNIKLIDMVGVINKSIKVKGGHTIIDETLVMKFARDFYNQQMTAKSLEGVYKTQPKSLSSKATPKAEKESRLRDMETLSPHAYLEMMQGSVPVAQDLLIIEGIMLNQKIRPAVANAIINYALTNNDGRMVKNYVEKIAAEISRVKIEKAKDAIMHLETKPAARKKSKKNKEITPGWYNTEEEVSLTSQEKIDEINKLKKEL